MDPGHYQCNDDVNGELWPTRDRNLERRSIHRKEERDEEEQRQCRSGETIADGNLKVRPQGHLCTQGDAYLQLYLPVNQLRKHRQLRKTVTDHREEVIRQREEHCLFPQR